MRPLFCAVVVLLLAGVAPSIAGAQEATPTAGFVTPDPAECTVDPRTIDVLKGYITTPAADAIPTNPADFTVPEGSPADDAQIAGVTTTVNEINACDNANAFLRMFALYSDGYLARSIPGEDLNPDALDLLATPIAPQDASTRTAYEVDDIVVLEDGRIGALVVTFSPYGGGSYSTTWMAFVEQDGRYLVDDLVNLPDSSAEATPAAG